MHIYSDNDGDRLVVSARDVQGVYEERLAMPAQPRPERDERDAEIAYQDQLIHDKEGQIERLTAQRDTWRRRAWIALTIGCIAASLLSAAYRDQRQMADAWRAVAEGDSRRVVGTVE